MSEEEKQPEECDNIIVIWEREEVIQHDQDCGFWWFPFDEAQ
jgi:hypothetical protein